MIVLPLSSSHRARVHNVPVSPVSRLRWLALLLLVPTLLLITSCSPDAGLRQYASAVGPDLYSSQTIRNTSLLDAYTTSLCQQAGIADASGRCQISTTDGWKTFVDMGLYDIDQRCDSFLDSLYYKDKSNDAVLAQVSNTRSLTSAVLDAAAASNVAMRIVAAAFDFSESSFRNVNTTLLQALDATTVKSIVFKRQQDVKREIYSATISNRPQALHALRTYLRVCMPFTIEMEANALLTTFQRTGDSGNALISFYNKPQTADTVVHKPARSRLGEDPSVIELFGTGTAKRPKDLQTVQRKLCAPTTGRFDPATRAAVNIYRESTDDKNKDWHVLSRAEADRLLDRNFPNCDRSKYIDYYETSVLAGDGFSAFVTAFNAKAAEGQKLTSNDALSSDLTGGFRKRIVGLKQALPNLAGPVPDDANLAHVTRTFYTNIMREK
jgi:hypothetical protein